MRATNYAQKTLGLEGDMNTAASQQKQRRTNRNATKCGKVAAKKSFRAEIGAEHTRWTAKQNDETTRQQTLSGGIRIVTRQVQWKQTAKRIGNNESKEKLANMIKSELSSTQMVVEQQRNAMDHETNDNKIAAFEHKIVSEQISNVEGRAKQQITGTDSKNKAKSSYFAH